jgi:hypothetical protein
MTVVWRTLETSAPSHVDYRVAGTAAWQTITGARRTSGTTGTLHEATLSGLSASTRYEYRVMGNGGVWSDVYDFRTAPAFGPADFSVAFVADTGLIGRLDGLTTGTEQVRDEIARLRPTLTLGGGDYIYYNTDTRYGTLNNSIDAWFNQMQPIAAYSALMPTYGNHEALLGEGLQHWQPRFAHPSGHTGQNFYSFDVADVHFVSILAVSDTSGISAAALDWIDQDMAAARARGQRWIVPFFHAVAFGDGTNHPSNAELRRQFGPVFERHDVKIALYTHDQAYERSYPLRGVPDQVVRTSNSLACYEADDGVTWVKTSPGGKLSNKNAGFSNFRSSTPPTWTAYRNNTIHNFGRLTFSADGRARYEAHGVVGTGVPPTVIDSFEYRLSEPCPGTLTFEPREVAFTLESNGRANAMVALSGTLAGSVTVSETAPWLAVTPLSTVVPGAIQLTADASGLTPGTYVASVNVTGSGFADASLKVTLIVGGGYRSVVSLTSNRANPVDLAGQTVSGNVYVFTQPTSLVTRVDFYLDDPNMSRSPRKTETGAPHDLAGTRSDGTANPFDTRTVADGTHTLTAKLTLTVGTVVVTHAQFVVANDVPPQPGLIASPSTLSFLAQEGSAAVAQTISVSSNNGTGAAFGASANVPWVVLTPASSSTPGSVNASVDIGSLSVGTHSALVTFSSPTHGSISLPLTATVTSSSAPAFALLYSTSANRAGPRALDGATVQGSIAVFSSPDVPEIDRVLFWLDKPTMSGSPRRSEGTAPYDFAGGTVASATLFDTRTIGNGAHTITARVQFVDGTSLVLHASFSVAN